MKQPKCRYCGMIINCKPSMDKCEGTYWDTSNHKTCECAFCFVKRCVDENYIKENQMVAEIQYCEPYTKKQILAMIVSYKL